MRFLFLILLPASFCLAQVLPLDVDDFSGQESNEYLETQARKNAKDIKDIKSDNINWTGDHDFQGGLTASGSEVQVSTSIAVTGDIKGSTITFATLNQVCPSGFNAVKSTTSAHAPSLGCIEQAEQSTAVYPDALMECFQNHGGRFPSVTEFQIAGRLGIIDGATGNFEWTDNMDAADSRVIVGNSSIYNTTSANEVATYPYRCFLPR